jgi:benzoylformate decarboxylase
VSRPVDALLEILADEGVTHVFGNPGTTELPLLDALAEHPGLAYVLGLHEGGLVAMADGYARATHRPAFVNLHAVAGVSNGLIGLHNARRSQTPLVVTAGQQDRRFLRDEPMLSGDLVGLARPAVKSAVEVQHEADLPVLLRRAFAEAVRPPAGPVFLSIPMDLLASHVPVTVPAKSPAVLPGVAAGLDNAAGALTAAQNPVIVAGDGVGRERAVPELVAVAEALGAPVFHSPMADGINFPTAHPLYQGMPAPTSDDLRTTLEPFDVAFLVGVRPFTLHHYKPGASLPPGITVVQLESDPAALGRTFPVSVVLSGGLRPTLRDLASRLASPQAPARAARWHAATAASRATVDTKALSRYGSRPLDPLAAVHALAKGLPPDAVVIEEAITAGLLLRQVLRQERPGSYRHTLGGGLGWGIGAAIGTRLGDPGRPVVAVLGDGCAMFGLQALWTAAHLRVPVTFVVLANNEYRTLKDTLDRDESRSTRLGRYVGLDLRPPAVDWVAAGRTFGVEVVTATSEVALTEAVAPGEGPLLLHVPIRGHA